MMEQGVSNLQRSFHSSCSWEKYIIHSSLAIKWSSAFSFLPVLCRTEKLLFFFLFLSFACWKHCWAQSRAQSLPVQSLGVWGTPWAPITPFRLGKQRQTFGMNLKFLQELMAFLEADSKQRGCRKQDKEWFCHCKKFWNPEILMMHLKLAHLKHLQEHRPGAFAGSPPGL